jgi:hypothetical protein
MRLRGNDIYRIVYTIGAAGHNNPNDIQPPEHPVRSPVRRAYRVEVGWYKYNEPQHYIDRKPWIRAYTLTKDICVAITFTAMSVCRWWPF